jgi:hypothetical protein
MDNLEEKVIAIIEYENGKLISLPSPERERLCKILLYWEIRTVYKMIKKEEAHTTKAWRNRQWNWLRNLVTSYERERETENDIKRKV